MFLQAGPDWFGVLLRETVCIVYEENIPSESRCDLTDQDMNKGNRKHVQTMDMLLATQCQPTGKSADSLPSEALALTWSSAAETDCSDYSLNQLPF